MSNETKAASGLLFKDDGATPNHPRFELLVHRGAARDALRTSEAAAAAIEALFAANGWTGLWRNGIYAFDHYHSTCCEALGVASGWAEVRFGGARGETVRLEAGDVAVLPPGTGHRRIEASSDFLVVGAYPPGQPYDMIRSGDAAAHDDAVARIAAVPVPATDPVFGAEGGLRARWTGT